MVADIRETARRYLQRRRKAGLEVAFLLERTGGGNFRPDDSALAVVTSDLEGVSFSQHAGKFSENPGGKHGEGELSHGADREENAIRYSREARRVEQSSLFEETSKVDRLDLSSCDLVSLERLVSSCRRCNLADCRTKTVFGSGTCSARIVFVGEAPGREEDLQGLPFVGRAGQLLTKMLAAIGFTREEVYITNILKCRPPNNRDPQEDEMETCGVYLERQLEILKPVLICALGRIAAHGLLKKGTSLSFLRQAVHYYDDIPVAVTYHPAALLRNPALKRDTWEDLKKLRRLYDERMAKAG